MTTHILKVIKPFFKELKNGNKKFEVRFNDRNFQAGDNLILKEYCSKTEKFTGKRISKGITYVLTGGQFGIEEGYVVLSLGCPLLTPEEKETVRFMRENKLI